MSPLCIRILLHYYWSPEDYHETEEDAHARSAAVAEAFDFFLGVDLLKSRFGDRNWAVRHAPFLDSHQGSEVEKPVFEITDKGRAMVDHLCAVQVPVCQWVQP